MIAEQTLTSQGVLELHPKGYGFLRNPARHYAAQPATLRPRSLIQRSRFAKAAGRRSRRGRPQGQPAPDSRAWTTSKAAPRRSPPRLRRTDAIDPHEQIRLETGREPLTTRSWTS